MALQISSNAPIISSQGRAICNFSGQIDALTAMTWDITPVGSQRVDAGTFQNLSSCWLQVTLALDNAKDDTPLGEYCFVLAPGQVKNLHFHGEYIQDEVDTSSVAIVSEPTGFGKVACDYSGNNGSTPIDDPDITAFLDVTYFRA